MINTRAKTTPKITELEKKNALISRKIAGEGIVLLKNNGVLPLKEKKLALYGEGADNTVKGGIGSGEVNSRCVVSIHEGLKNAGYEISSEKWLADYLSMYNREKREYTEFMRRKSGFINFSALKYLLEHPFKDPEGMLIEGKYLTDSDVCIYVISRLAGENVDRTPTKGDFLLSDREIQNIRICSEHYKDTILVINAGGYIDLTDVEDLDLSAIVFFCQQGAEGGNAFADIVSGKISPSGKLTGTWPMNYGDIPFGADFSILNGNTKYEEYKEGIYVGYRYFDSFGVTPRYPFGFGLSYTVFDLRSELTCEQSIVSVSTEVRNIGSAAGKEVVQVWVSCPQGRLDKEAKRLVAFAKTKELRPGESETVTLSFDMSYCSSFDEEHHCFILERGDYIVRVGNSSADTVPVATIRNEKEIILSKHKAICPKQSNFPELRSSIQNESVNVPVFILDSSAFRTVEHTYDQQQSESSNSFSAAENISLCMGTGLDIALPKKHDFMVPGADAYSSEKLKKKGIFSVNFADGPAGLRLFDVSVRHLNTVRMTKPVMASFDYLPTLARNIMIKKPTKGRTYYQYATAFPIGMALGQSWNRSMAELLGTAVRDEMKEFGVNCWLAPGMNLYRNPLCGRNYEYFSEDPVLSGKMAAAIVRAVQSDGVTSATVKHFCCNNQEIDRRTISENVGERALRELYLRNFEIAVSEGRPKALMTAYNKINGVYCSENHDVVTSVLRCEWKYNGLIMTDWTTEKNMLNSATAISAGVNMMMPGIGSDKSGMKTGLKNGALSPLKLKESADFVLSFIRSSKNYGEKK